MGMVPTVALLMLMMPGQAQAPAPAEPLPKLKIPPIEILPVFRATVDSDPLLDNPLQGMRRELAADPGSHPGRGMDVWPAVMGMVNGIKRARRARAEREIRQEVQSALNDFCAARDCSAIENGPPSMEGVILPRKAPGP